MNKCRKFATHKKLAPPTISSICSMLKVAIINELPTRQRGDPFSGEVHFINAFFNLLTQNILISDLYPILCKRSSEYFVQLFRCMTFQNSIDPLSGQGRFRDHYLTQLYLYCKEDESPMGMVRTLSDGNIPIQLLIDHYSLLNNRRKQPMFFTSDIFVRLDEVVAKTYYQLRHGEPQGSRFGERLHSFLKVYERENDLAVFSQVAHFTIQLLNTKEITTDRINNELEFNYSDKEMTGLVRVVNKRKSK